MMGAAQEIRVNGHNHNGIEVYPLLTEESTDPT
jgi:hypothetical protein